MAESNKYAAPTGPPPSYPQPPAPAQHFDAGPYNPNGPEQQYYGAPQGQYGPPQGQYGPPQGQYNQYGPPPQGYYGQPQPMYYQQQPAPVGYYNDSRRGPGAGEGCCAAILASLACCCCLDILF